jgi:hypothetical protein
VRRFSAAEIFHQRARLARGRNPELRAQPLGELPSGGQRRGAIAARREPLDQPAIGRFRQRVQRHLGPGQPDRLAWVAGRGRCLLQRRAEPV